MALQIGGVMLACVNDRGLTQQKNPLLGWVRPIPITRLAGGGEYRRRGGKIVLVPPRQP